MAIGSWLRSFRPTRVGKILVDRLRLQPGSRVLEIGSASGNQARQLAGLGYRVFGLDSDLPLIRSFNSFACQDGLTAFGLVGDGQKLPFPDGCFDAVYSTEVLEHVPDPERLLAEANRVLKKGAVLCVGVPTEQPERLFRRLHPRWIQNSGHQQLFSTRTLRGLLEGNGFEITEVRGESFEWSLFWLIFATLRTPFDFTGTPTGHLLAVRIYLKVWRTLNQVYVVKPLQWVGDRVFPKSVYMYGFKK